MKLNEQQPSVHTEPPLQEEATGKKAKREMKLPCIFLLLCLQNQTQGKDENPKPTCYRIRRKVLLHQEMTTLTYINEMWTEIEQQQEQKLIRNSTADMIFQSLERMSHGWCDPRIKSPTKEDKKEKRSITTILATIFALGSLIIGPAIAAVLTDIAHNTQWRITELKREMETTHLLADLEKRINAHGRVEEVIASIFLHESIMRDLIHSTDNNELNRTWKRILKHQILEYEKLGLIKNTAEEVLGSSENSLPKGTYKIRAKVHKNKDCGKTRITITAVGLIPDKSCLELHSDQDKDRGFTRLKTTTQDMCVFAGKDKALLADNTTFLTSNTVVGPCNNSESFEFRSKENTILVRPEQSRGFMTTLCKDKQTWTTKILTQTTRKILYRDRLYALPLHCSSWIATEKKRTINPRKDYQQLEEIFISATNGQEITPNTLQPTMIFYAIEEVKDLRKKEKIFMSDKEHRDFLESFAFLNTELDKIGMVDTTKTRIIVTIVIALVLVVVLVIFCKIKKRLKAIPNLAVEYIRGKETRKEEDTTDNNTDAAEEFVRLLFVEERGGREQIKERKVNGPEQDIYIKRKVTINEEPIFEAKGGKKNLKAISGEVNAEPHYDVPRILYGNKWATTQEEYTDEPPPIPKKKRTIEKEMQEKKDNEASLKDDITAGQSGGETKATTDTKDNTKREQKDQEETEIEEKEDWSEEEKATEYIYETISCREGKLENNTTPEQCEESLKENTDDPNDETKTQEKEHEPIKEKTKDTKEHSEDRSQKKLHNHMLDELHVQFRLMAEQHKIDLT